MSKKSDQVLEMEKELKALERELTDSTQIVKDLEVRRTAIRKQITSLNNALRQMKPKNLVVSDHAVLRYLQRHHGVEVEKIRDELKAALLGAKDMGSVKALGFVIENNCVVTYLDHSREVQSTLIEGF